MQVHMVIKQNNYKIISKTSITLLLLNISIKLLH